MLGFNQDERGLRVFDGILNWIGGGNGVGINYRFAQTARTERNRQNHRYPEAPFPFAWPELVDPYTGKIAGRGVRCAQTGTCPKVMETNSSNEYWVKTGSLLHSDPSGRHLPRDPENVRFYLLSSVEHTVGGAPPRSAGSCQQFRNSTNPNPALRALFVAPDEWVTRGVRPPHSEVPGPGTALYSIPLSDGVGFVQREALGWPDIPGVTYSGLITVRHLFNFGPRFHDASCRLSPRRSPPPADGARGMDARTEAERRALGDPRRSLEERYGTHQGYVNAVSEKARSLQARRLLLPEDVQRYIDEAQASDVLR
jgi:hypothetical protein